MPLVPYPARFARHLPLEGKRDRATVDRVLSYNGALEAISLALFHTAILIQSPPLRGTSFHRKEGVSTRAPSKGRGSRGHSLLPMEGGAPKGRRLAGKSGMKKSGKDRLKCVVYESTRAPLCGPPSPMGKAKRRGLRRPERKPTPPRCARQPLPREGARVDIPSFLWKEVPRRGGGWMGKWYPRHKAFPSRGRWRAKRAG